MLILNGADEENRTLKPVRVLEPESIKEPPLDIKTYENGAIPDADVRGIAPVTAESATKMTQKPAIMQVMLTKGYCAIVSAEDYPLGGSQYK